MEQNDWSPRTLAITAGRPHGVGEPLNTPLVPASTFDGNGTVDGARVYARQEGTATWAALEEAIGALEGGHATAFASGIATAAAAFDLLPVGAEVAVPVYSYGGTRELLAHAERTGRLRVRRLPPGDTAAWQEAAGQVRLLWLESPTNPTLDLMDIAAISAAARARGADRPLVAVDNTFATPFGQRPLALGADLVVHSATKLIGGHSDLLLGLTVAAEPALAGQLAGARTRAGATPGALECWLALRGLRTLHLRLTEQSATAALLAERLAGHPAVTSVRYPGLGVVIALELAGAEPADRLCRGLRLIRHATSLGGVESMVERRAGLAGDSHVPPGLVRFSVGLEEPDDLWQDLAGVLDSLPISPPVQPSTASG